MTATPQTQRDLFEAAVIKRMKESGFLEVEIRVECLARCDDGYCDPVINAGWHYWNAALAAAQRTPDYCYDPADWEFTCDWSEKDQVHGYGEALKVGEPLEIATLIRGPRKWVADVPVTWDADGDPDNTEVQWFDTEEEARAALKKKGTDNGNG